MLVFVPRPRASSPQPYAVLFHKRFPPPPHTRTARSFPLYVKSCCRLHQMFTNVGSPPTGLPPSHTDPPPPTLSHEPGPFDRSEPDGSQQQRQRSQSPVRSGKRARPLSPLQPSSHFPAADARAAPSSFGGGSFGSFQQQRAQREAEDGELAALRQEVRVACGVCGTALCSIYVRGKTLSGLLIASSLPRCVQKRPEATVERTTFFLTSFGVVVSAEVPKVSSTRGGRGAT